MAFVRERGNVVDYEIPISGDLKDPKFHLRDVVFDVVSNIFVKPATSPYRFEVKNTENEIEKSLTIIWALRELKLRDKQVTFMNKMADFLKDNAEATITVRPYQYEEKEKEYILFYEAKKKYYFWREKRSSNTMSENDSIAIDKMSAKDSLFVRYLDNYVKDSMLFTVQQKCYRLVGTARVNKILAQQSDERQRVFLQYFLNNGTSKQVKFLGLINTIPKNGFSYFRIEYKGDVPESLRSAYEKINEMDSEKPRKKYQIFRKNN